MVSGKRVQEGVEYFLNRISVPILSKMHHHYLFLIGGQWIATTNFDTEDNGFYLVKEKTDVLPGLPFVQSSGLNTLME